MTQNLFFSGTNMEIMEKEIDEELIRIFYGWKSMNYL